MAKAASKIKGKSKAKSKAARKSPASKQAASKNKNKAKGAFKRALYLTEADVLRLVDVKDAIATLELLFETWPDPATVNLPRQRAPIGNGTLNLMGAAWGASEVFGLKAYYGVPGGRFHVLLYSSTDAQPQGDDRSRPSRPHPHRRGERAWRPSSWPIRKRARSASSAPAGRPSRRWRRSAPCARSRPCACSPARAAHREAFAKEIERKLRVAAAPATSAEAAVGDADVVITITKSAEPVLRANWLKSGVHVNAAGANAASRREVDAETVLRATVRATDHVAQARVEAGEYRDFVAAGRLSGRTSSNSATS